VPVVLLLVAAVILGGVIVVAIGRGGELGSSEPDIRPLDTEIVTAADVALLRPPASLWGYNIRVTDEALNLVARTVTERDVEIATLRRQLADLQSALEGRSDRDRGQTRDWAGTTDFGQATDTGQATEWGGTTDVGQARDTGQTREWSRHSGQATDLGRPRDLGQAADPGASAHRSRPLVPGQARAAQPPAETRPWSAWERPGPAPRPEHGETGQAGPEESG
jgi:hypothetical protein